MSQPDLISALRLARPAAPPELRERVRQLAAGAPAPPRRLFTWRRAALVLVPVAAAIAATAVFLPRGERGTAVHGAARSGGVAEKQQLKAFDSAAAANVAPRTVPAPSSTRPQRYTASLELRLANSAAVSDAAKRATRIVTALGGYASSLNVNARSREGYASLVLKVPRAKVALAVQRLSDLGRVVGENVAIQDLGAQVSATDRLIARLQSRLAALEAKTQDEETVRQVAALKTRIEKLERGRAATMRTAQYATVDLRLTTVEPAAAVERGDGPLHGLGIAFHWLWIGAVYAFALGAPAAALAVLVWLLVRGVRRRREDALLSRS